MTSKYTQCAILVLVSVVTTAFGDAERKDKWTSNCLTEEYIQTRMEMKDATFAACKAEMGPSSHSSTETVDDAKSQKPSMCFTECLWRHSGLVKDGRIMLEDYAKANVKPEFQDKMVSEFQGCLAAEGLPTTYTLNKEDQCRSLQKYGTCWLKAVMAC